eukprot:scaffold385029_cov37-Prasinocladus_malaysianus.AAC.1
MGSVASRRMQAWRVASSSGARRSQRNWMRGDARQAPAASRSTVSSGPERSGHCRRSMLWLQARMAS